MKFLPACAALLLATSLAAHAQAPAAPKMVSKDELRVCMNTEVDLAARRTALTARGEANRAEGAAIRAEAAEMGEEQKAVEGNEAKMDRFNRKVKAHNARVEAQSGSAAALRADLEGLNKGLVAYNASCGGISYSREDKEAILKEREAAAKKN
jgi:hypothetical protein